MDKIIYGICFVLVTLISESCISNRVKLPPLEETFSYKDKNPFGTFVLHNHLELLYMQNAVRDVTINFEKTWRDISDTGSVYICISRNLFLTKADLTGMMAYVHDGNSLFISSHNIDPRLLDTLGCVVGSSFYDQFFPEMKYTYVKMAKELYRDTTAYQYFFVPFNSHFTKFNNQQTRVLGNNKTGPNFIVVFHGRGRFYLHVDPGALSNYFLLQKDNYNYFRNVFSFTPAIPEHVYWDDFYNKRNFARTESGNKSRLSVLLQYPAMAWAFWLLLVIFLLYIYFGGKRRQRIVPTLPQNTNTTLTFTETIGRLYLQKKDNRNIADKLITYFLEQVRNQYYLITSHFNDEFITTLSRKSNNTKEGTQKLFESIASIQQSSDVSDQQLLSLNHQIENFYKNSI